MDPDAHFRGASNDSDKNQNVETLFAKNIYTKTESAQISLCG
jgi:hypothetical protein